jgi:hypothetical protein
MPVILIFLKLQKKTSNCNDLARLKLEVGIHLSMNSLYSLKAARPGNICVHWQGATYLGAMRFFSAQY